MKNQPLILERTFDASIEAVWTAISDREAMAQWYFDMEGFKPEVGCHFGFTSVGPTVTRVHLCEIKELEKNRKLSYSFRLGGNPGDTLVTFELFPEGNKTRLKLTHTGIETFAAAAQELKNFTGGWNTLINTRLVVYLAKMNKKNYHCTITAAVTVHEAFTAISHVQDWWTVNCEGASEKIEDSFTVRFGETFVTSKVADIIADKKIVWLVTDSYKHWLEGNRKEWTGTYIAWEISVENDKARIDFTQIGLVPELECYTGCEKGWNFYIKESLLKLLTEGKGLPDTQQAAR